MKGFHFETYLRCGAHTRTTVFDEECILGRLDLKKVVRSDAMYTFISRYIYLFFSSCSVLGIFDCR